MATSPSNPLSPGTPETPPQVPSNDLPTNVQNDDLKSGPGQILQADQKANLGRPASASSRAPLPATYYLKPSDARGKHMVQYVYANLRDPNDASLPLHVREKYKEIEKERSRGYQPAVDLRGTSPTRTSTAAPQNSAVPVKAHRPASAGYERRSGHGASYSQGQFKSSRNETDYAKGGTPVKVSQRTTTPVQQTRSSNAVVSRKRNSRSRSKTASPQPRRPFSIAADSTSDTDPIENQRSVESIAHSPPRIMRSRHLRRQQFLATKFKLAAKNSKHTQTFVASVLSVDESSGSATTVISRHHSTTQTDGASKKAVDDTAETSQQDHQTSNISEPNDNSAQLHALEADKPPIVPPQNIANTEAKPPDQTQRAPENLQWKRAKIRLRSTPGSPSPPPPEGRHRVLSADRVRRGSNEKPPSVAGTQAVSGQSVMTRPSSAGRLASPVSDKRFTTSSTQIEENFTVSTGVQVKIKKRHSSHRRERKEKRSPSQKSVASRASSRSESRAKDKRKSKKSKKKRSAKSRDPSVRSLRSLRSYQSDASAGILKRVTLKSTSPAHSHSGSRRAGSAAASITASKKKKTKKKKKKHTSNKIARFLRQLSKDKEAIKVISKMAATNSKKSSK